MLITPQARKSDAESWMSTAPLGVFRSPNEYDFFSQHVSVWERTFDFFDRDGSGSIEQHEILERLQGMGFDERGVDQLFQDIAGKHP